MRRLLLGSLIFLCISGCATQTPSVSVGHKSVGQDIQALNIVFDAKTGEINYTLLEPALVRIRVGIVNSGPLLTHLLDWEYRDKGNHQEIWDGTIPGSNVNLRGRSDLMVVLKAIAAHNKHDAKKGFKLRLDFPESKEKNSDGLVVMSGKMPVKISIDEKDAKWLANTRYESIIFIDNLFLAEEEEGINPFTYYFDTSHFSNGAHTITVNVAAMDGLMGTQSAMVEINNHR